MTLEAAQATAEKISKERLLTVTALGQGGGYIARFSTDQGLRGFGQSLINHNDQSFGLLILEDGSVPQVREARTVLQPQLAEREEVIATVQLAFDCPREPKLSDQAHMINADLLRLLDEDSTTGAVCVTISIRHLSPEAETYGNVEPSNVAAIQADAMGEALTARYPDIELNGEKLRAALCDLRHFAKAHRLDFSRWDKSAVQHYQAEADQ